MTTDEIAALIEKSSPREVYNAIRAIAPAAMAGINLSEWWAKDCPGAILFYPRDEDSPDAMILCVNAPIEAFATWRKVADKADRTGRTVVLCRPFDDYPQDSVFAV